MTTSRNSRILWIILLLITICLFSFPAQAQYGGGTGEPNDPYLIYTAEQMNEIGLHEQDQSKHFKLMADIDLSAYSGTAFNMIGTFGGRGGSGFAGVFDGNDHTISNFTFTSTSTYPDRVGIFASIWGRINNLGLIDPNIDAEAGYVVGPLAGWLEMGTITNCYVVGGKISGGRNIGGLVGGNSGHLANCYVVGGKISGESNVGGLIGINHGHVANCFSYCTIQAEDTVGGLVGRNDGIIMTSCSYAGITGIIEVGGLVGNNWGEIVNCYTRGEVVGQQVIGGLVGNNLIFGHGFGGYGIIRNCYSTTTVSGNEHIGGLIGYSGDDEIADSFWHIETGSQTTSKGGIGKTTAEMQDPNTFIDAGWDFMNESANGTEDIWWILEGRHYPRLWWQYGQAFSPYPQDGATDVIQPVILSWLPGGLGLYHEVYFGEDEEAVAKATTESPVIYRGRLPVEVTTYDPGILELYKTYYWRVDEVVEDDPNSPWKGNIWSFTTADFLIVDDFESYNDLDPIDPESNRLWMTWIDGYDSTIFNGSTVGPGEPPFSEQNIVHSGYQSMSFLYDNSGPAIFSLATANIDRLAIDRDWTKSGIKILSLWFYGFPDNAAEPMFVSLANAIGMPVTVYHVNPEAALINTWTQWNIYLQEFADQGVDLTNINWISIGFDNRKNQQPGGAGHMYFDDIRLYRSP